jgi:hypothetical protein
MKKDLAKSIHTAKAENSYCRAWDQSPKAVTQTLLWSAFHIPAPFPIMAFLCIVSQSPCSVCSILQWNAEFVKMESLFWFIHCYIPTCSVDNHWVNEWENTKCNVCTDCPVFWKCFLLSYGSNKPALSFNIGALPFWDVFLWPRQRVLPPLHIFLFCNLSSLCESKLL